MFISLCTIYIYIKFTDLYLGFSATRNTGLEIFSTGAHARARQDQALVKSGVHLTLTRLNMDWAGLQCHFSKVCRRIPYSLRIMHCESLCCKGELDWCQI